MVRCGGPTAAAPGVGQGGAFGALGGATSPDRWGDLAKYRWEHETTTREDLDRLVDNAPDGLDILICHDAPAGTTGLTIGLLRKLHPYLQHEADTVKALLRSAVDETEPTLVVHGHWHQQNRCRLIHSSTEAVGLAGDGRPGCAAILSISDMHARYLGPLDPPAADTPAPIAGPPAACAALHHRHAYALWVPEIRPWSLTCRDAGGMLSPGVPNLVPIPGITGSAHCALRPLEGP